MLRNRALQEGPLKKEDRGMCLTHQLSAPLSPGPGSVGGSAPRSETEKTSPNLGVLRLTGVAWDKRRLQIFFSMGQKPEKLL